VKCEICGELALGQVVLLLPVLRFCSVSIMPPVSHTHLYLHIALTWDPLKSSALTGIGDHTCMIEKYSLILFVFQVGRAVAQTPAFHRRCLGFDYRSVHVRFVADRVAVGLFFRIVILVLSVSIISLALQSPGTLNTVLSGQADEAWVPSKKQCFFG
jgi:hypothetical protein